MRKVLTEWPSFEGSMWSRERRFDGLASLEVNGNSQPPCNNQPNILLASLISNRGRPDLKPEEATEIDYYGQSLYNAAG